MLAFFQPGDSRFRKIAKIVVFCIFGVPFAAAIGTLIAVIIVGGTSG